MSLFKSPITVKPVFISATTWRQSFLLLENPLHQAKEKTIHDRSSVIPIPFLGTKVHIYNGKVCFSKRINKWVIGFKFGEFTWNRKLALYKAKQLRKKLKKKKK